MTSHAITTLEQLREIYEPPLERSIRKELDRLDEHCRHFISMSPFVLIASADARGACDVSPKGGPPGFVTVLDDHRLLIPDATGNRRLDSLQNMLENPRVGLLFLLPGMGETLRANGRVELTRDPELLVDLQTGGRPAALALVVDVEQAYLHCAKCIIRSGLWRSETWPDRDELPSAAEILSDHIGLRDVSASEAALAESYTQRI
jgi:PPOX class probable FMN-dependent enzyme